MRIRIRLFATLRLDRGKELVLDLAEDSTVADIIEELKIDRAEVAILLINGRDGQLDTPLSNEDVVSIFPPVGGG